MQGLQTGAFEAVLIEPGFQRRQRAQDADTRAFPAALPHMADHGVDHVHEAHGPPVALSFSRAASNILGLWAVLQGIPMTVAPAAPVPP